MGNHRSTLRGHGAPDPAPRLSCRAREDQGHKSETRRLHSGRGSGCVCLPFVHPLLEALCARRPVKQVRLPLVTVAGLQPQEVDPGGTCTLNCRPWWPYCHHVVAHPADEIDVPAPTVTCPPQAPRSSGARAADFPLETPSLLCRRVTHFSSGSHPMGSQACSIVLSEVCCWDRDE